MFSVEARFGASLALSTTRDLQRRAPSEGRHRPEEDHRPASAILQWMTSGSDEEGDASTASMAIMRPHDAAVGELAAEGDADGQADADHEEDQRDVRRA